MHAILADVAARQQLDAGGAEIAEQEARAHPPAHVEGVAEVQARPLEHHERAREAVPVDGRAPLLPEEHLDGEPAPPVHGDGRVAEPGREVVLHGDPRRLEDPARHVDPGDRALERRLAERGGRERGEGLLVEVEPLPRLLNPAPSASMASIGAAAGRAPIVTGEAGAAAARCADQASKRSMLTVKKQDDE